MSTYLHYKRSIKGLALRGEQHGEEPDCCSIISQTLHVHSPPPVGAACQPQLTLDLGSPSLEAGAGDTRTRAWK